jgi:tetratricopeptide (TPR) repeat protein
VSGTFDWLIADIRERLPAEGKDDLAQALRRAITEKGPAACDEAAAMARRQGEHRLELFVGYLEVIDGYGKRGDSCQALLDKALALVAKAGEIGLDIREERLCYYNYALILLDAVDLPGYAPDILALVDELDGTLPRGLECRSCILPSRGRARQALGDLDAAEAVFTEELGRAPKATHRIWRILDLAEIAAARGREGEAEALFERAEGEAGRLAEPDRDVDNRLAGARIQLELAAGRLDGAILSGDALLDRVEGWNLEGIDADLSIARRLAQDGRALEACERAERCAGRAEARGARRRHAEARLIAAETLTAAGRAEAAAAHVAALEQVVPALRSRDLDARALAVGARLDAGAPVVGPQSSTETGTG